MKPKKLFPLIFIFIQVLLMTSSTIVLGNSAEPPRLVVLVSNSPKDLEVSIRFENVNPPEVVKLNKNINIYWSRKTRQIFLKL